MTNPLILLADDDDAVCMVVTHALQAEGYGVRRTADFAELMRWVEAGEGDAVISDVVMPSGDGLAMLPHIKAMRPELPVIIISAQNTLMTAVKSTEGGAFDYLPKPFDLDVLSATVARAVRPQSAMTGGEALERLQHENMALIGASAAMQDVFKSIARVVGNDLTVMICGESGTGKELVARAIHNLSARQSGPFVAVNMGAIPTELVESELFGYEKGAFTGAAARQEGKFAQGSGGTLFLDEIGDMPLVAQTALLRVLQQGEYMPVGSARMHKADARIICATHRDLAAMVAEGTFREDLFYRLNVVPLDLPPLRERREDVADLARHFLRRAQDQALGSHMLDHAALDLLCEHDWPGNVRELENLMLRLAAMSGGGVIGRSMVASQLAGAGAPRAVPGKSPLLAVRETAEPLEEQLRGHIRRYFVAHGSALPPDGLYDRMLLLLEKPLIEETLRSTGGNQLRAAKLLGINRNTLRKKMKEQGISHHRLLAEALPPAKMAS